MILVHLDTWEMMNDEPRPIGVFSTRERAIQGGKTYLHNLGLTVITEREEPLFFYLTIDTGKSFKFLTDTVELDKVIL